MKHNSRQFIRFLTVPMLMVLILSVLCGAAFAAQAETEDQGCHVRGDLNSDGIFSEQDAIHLLYHQFFDGYEISGNGDLNGDGVCDSRDAVFAAAEENRQALEDTVHVYAQPYWIWTEQEGSWSAKLNMDCSCREGNQTHQAVMTKESKLASCTEAGSDVFTATVTLDDGTVYTDSRTVELPALGHLSADRSSCDQVLVCTREGCGVELEPAIGHQWEISEEKSVASTCKEPGKDVYDCQLCGAESEVVLPLAEHAFALVPGSEHAVAVESETCVYQIHNTYECEVCKERIDVTLEKTHVQHSYGDAVLTLAPSCVKAGSRSYTCGACQAEKTEEVSVNADAHKWDAGTAVEGAVVYHCTEEGCSAEKRTITVTAEEAIPQDALKESEIQIQSGDDDSQNVALSMDEKTVEGLEEGKDVKVSVEQVPAEELNLTEEQKEQLGDAAVYDLNMQYADDEGETGITEFDGYVTVSLPYTLEAGEDPQNIAVWFIDDDGNVELIQGSYADGFVVFRTTHFSYYTVTRLRPEERCALYGHLENEPIVKNATCTEDGYKRMRRGC